jgi:hypothetical protein
VVTIGHHTSAARSEVELAVLDPPTKASHSAGVNTSEPPPGFLLSRTATTPDSCGPSDSACSCSYAATYAERPSWDCRSCGKPWPCDPARERLVAERNQVPLAIYMWANMDEAIADLPVNPPSELLERFLRLTR